MKAWMIALAFGRRRRLVTLPPFTANGTVVFPPGVVAADVEGYGARGTNGSPGSSYYYETRTIYGIRRSDGATVAVYVSPRTFKTGSSGPSYCNPPANSPTDPTYSANYTCYAFDGHATTPPTDPTTGASATALGKTFPGSYRNTAPPVTKFTDVPVSAGTSYNVVVPAGGSITISYYQ